MRGWLFRGGHGEGSKVKARKTSGGGRTPVRHTIPLGIVIFLLHNISFRCIRYTPPPPQQNMQPNITNKGEYV